MFFIEDKVGEILTRYPFLDEVLFQFTESTNLVHDDADYSLRDFAEMVGADVEDIIKELKKGLSKR